MANIWLVFVLCVFASSYAFTINDGLVVSTTEHSSSVESIKYFENEATVPKIYEMHIFSNVSNRFSSTTIKSKVKNYGTKASQTTFAVVLPDHAYITGFTMEIDGKNYTAYIKEKEEAKKIYDQAVARGTGAAHVSTSVRNSNRFTVDVNIEPQSKAVFYLFYEELLKRKNVYEIVLNIQPKQPVPLLNVEVFINETSPLELVKTPSLRSGNEVAKERADLDPKATITFINEYSASVKFNPSITQQNEFSDKLGTGNKEGFSGQFVVQYDVKRQKNGGEILVKDGYFVHFFAPNDIKVMPKHIVFVLDTSGSMNGNRIKQLRKAMISILNNLNENDIFTLTSFDSGVKIWNINNNTYIRYNKNSDVNYLQAFQNIPNNIKNAETVINKMNVNGLTNIHDALKVGLQLIQLQKIEEENLERQPIIMFLTDGDPTAGITNRDKILSSISEVNFNVPIFSLSFGDGADRKFLQKLSLQNYGFARHIYESADASLQLEDFYKEISSPLLANVTFKYADNAKQLTKTYFPNYFKGGELVVCGFYNSKFALRPWISTCGESGKLDLTPEIKTPIGDMERIWAYLTVQQLLEEQEKNKNNTEIKQKALQLALKYSFVTPLTSLVVVKPNETEQSAGAEAADKSKPEINHHTPIPRIYSPSHNINHHAPSISKIHAPHHNRFLLRGPQGPPRPSYDIYDDDDDDYVDPSLKLSIKSKPKVYFTQSSNSRFNSNSNVNSNFNLLNFPWLNKIYSKDTDEVTLPNGVYKLGVGVTGVNETTTCTNSINNKTGVCTLLPSCHALHSKLTGVKKYMQFLCEIEGYGGVCCPKTI